MSKAESEVGHEPGSIAALAEIIGWEKVATVLAIALDEVRAERDRLKEKLASVSG